jgi:hypothetical protein
MEQNLPTLEDLYEAFKVKKDWNPLLLRRRFNSLLVDIVLKSDTENEALKKFRILFKDQAKAANKIDVTITITSNEVKETLTGNNGVLKLANEQLNAIGVAQAKRVIANYLHYLDRAFDEPVIRLHKNTVDDNKIPSDFIIYPLGKHMKIEIRNYSPQAEGALWKFDGNVGVIDVKFDFAGLEPSNSDSKTRFQVEANKAKLFCQYFLGGEERKKARWFLEEAVKLGLESFKTLYEGSLVVERIESFFNKFISNTHIADIHLKERGLLLYGPPGTGKTTIIKNMAENVGLTLVYPTFPAGAINEPLVGQAEKKVMDMFQRAREIPWLPCALVVDEIDGMAPARTGDTAEHKVALLSILLAEFGGIKDVPNMFVLGSTNRLQEMDEAFKRRMHQQIYVGVMSDTARATFLDSVLGAPTENNKRFNWKSQRVGLHDSVIDGLVAVKSTLMFYSQNFNIDLMTKFMDKLLFTLKVRFGNNALPNDGERILKELLGVVIKKCIAYYHLEGFSYVSEFVTLPSPIECSDKNPNLYFAFQINEQITRHNLPKTGRMVVHPALTNDKKVKVYCEGLHRQLSNYGGKYNDNYDYGYLVRAVLQAAQSNANGMIKVDYIQQINFLQMARAGVFEEQKVVGQIQSLLEEARKNYHRSISIVDVDQLVMVSDNSQSSDAVTPPSIMRMQVLEAISAQFNLIANSQNQIKISNAISYPAHWIILIVNDATIWRQIRDRIEWPSTDFDHADNNQTIGKQAVKECKQCGENYTEEENKPLSCIWHHGTYGRPGGPNTAMAMRHSFSDPNDDDQSSNNNNQPKPPKAKWSCCQRVGKDAQGCLKSKHTANDEPNTRLKKHILK